MNKERRSSVSAILREMIPDFSKPFPDDLLPGILERCKKEGLQTTDKKVHDIWYLLRSQQKKGATVKRKKSGTKQEATSVERLKALLADIATEMRLVIEENEDLRERLARIRTELA